MNSISTLFADCLNGFSISDIPFFCVQIFSAACLALIIKLAMKNKTSQKKQLQHLPLFAILLTFITILAKNSVTLGLIFIGAVILLKKDSTTAAKENGVPMLLAAVTGIGIGSGNVLLTAVVVIVSVCFISFIWKENSEE